MQRSLYFTAVFSKEAQSKEQKVQKSKHLTQSARKRSCITTKSCTNCFKKKKLDLMSSFFWAVLVNDEKFFQTQWDTPLSVICEKSGQISPQEGPTKLSVLKGDCQDQSWMIFQLENSLLNSYFKQVYNMNFPFFNVRPIQKTFSSTFGNQVFCPSTP